jgi:hypothetical protein
LKKTSQKNLQVQVLTLQRYRHDDVSARHLLRLSTCHFLARVLKPRLGFRLAMVRPQL